MKTVTIQIGNTDNKLTQEGWSAFVKMMRIEVQHHCHTIHFFGGPPNWESWQNVAWVITCEDNKLSMLKTVVADLRYRFQQESIAWIEGETEFI